MKQPNSQPHQPWRINMALLPTGATAKAFELLACEDTKKIAALFGYDFAEEDQVINLSAAYGMAAIEADFAILKMLSGKL